MIIKAEKMTPLEIIQVESDLKETMISIYLMINIKKKSNTKWKSKNYKTN